MCMLQNPRVKVVKKALLLFHLSVLSFLPLFLCLLVCFLMTHLSRGLCRDCIRELGLNRSPQHSLSIYLTMLILNVSLISLHLHLLLFVYSLSFCESHSHPVSLSLFPTLNHCNSPRYATLPFIEMSGVRAIRRLNLRHHSLHLFNLGFCQMQCLILNILNITFLLPFHYYLHVFSPHSSPCPGKLSGPVSSATSLARH